MKFFALGLVALCFFALASLLAGDKYVAFRGICAVAILLGINLMMMFGIFRKHR